MKYWRWFVHLDDLYFALLWYCPLDVKVIPGLLFSTLLTIISKLWCSPRHQLWQPSEIKQVSVIQQNTDLVLVWCRQPLPGSSCSFLSKITPGVCSPQLTLPCRNGCKEWLPRYSSPSTWILVWGRDWSGNGTVLMKPGVWCVLLLPCITSSLELCAHGWRLVYQQ